MVFKKDDTHFIYELALASKKECIAALYIHANFEHQEQFYSLKAHEVVSGSLDLFRVAPSGIALKDSKYLKSQLINMFSVFDTVLDVVLYEDNPTSSWFTRNGYVVVARDRKNCREKNV